MAKERVNTSLRLDKQVLKELKLHALENDSSVQQIVEKLIRDYLKKQRKKALEKASDKTSDKSQD